MNKVMVLGGFGHFGIKIAESLIKDDIPVIIVGRSEDKLSVSTKCIAGCTTKFIN